MPVVQPFRALLYSPALRPDLDRLVAPPYDVLSEEHRARLLARHPNNVVQIDRPHPRPGDDPYAESGHLMQSWIETGALVRDPRPAFYACEQTFVPPAGSVTTRRGFFARLSLEALEGGSILPHESTLDGPRADRRRLLGATRVHLSAVFLLHDDPGAVVAALVAEASRGATLLEAREGDQGTSRVVRLDDPGRLEDLTARLRGRWALIADGHHRYEAALAYRDERRALGRHDAEHVLAFLCSVEDPGLAIHPIHRLVHSLPGLDELAFRERLAGRFKLSPIGSSEDLLRRLAQRRGEPGVFGLLLPRGGRWLMEWSGGPDPEGHAPVRVPEPLRRMDVVLLHRLVFEEMLGIGPEAQARQEHLEYVKDERTVVDRIEAGTAQIGFLLNPTPIEQVIGAARAGLRLPQKTTYFFPKVLTGLVFDPLDEESAVPPHHT